MNLRNLLAHYYTACIGQCRSVHHIVMALYKCWCAVLETEPLKFAYKVSFFPPPPPSSPECKGMYLKLPGRLITGPSRLLSCWQKNGSGAEGCTSWGPAAVFMHQAWGPLPFDSSEIQQVNWAEWSPD